MRIFLAIACLFLFVNTSYAEQWIDGYKVDNFAITDWNGMPAPSVSPAGEARMYFDSTSNTLKLSEDGAAYSDIISVASGDLRYLRLDCSNDPLTGNLDLGANDLIATGDIDLDNDFWITNDATMEAMLAFAGDGTPNVDDLFMGGWDADGADVYYNSGIFRGFFQSFIIGDATSDDTTVTINGQLEAFKLGSEAGSPLIDGDRTVGGYSRVMITPDSGNNVMSFFISPGGTQDQANFQVNNDPDLDNRGRFIAQIDGALVYFITDKVGTGTAPTTIYIGEREATVAEQALTHIYFTFDNLDPFLDLDDDLDIADFQANTITTTGTVSGSTVSGNTVNAFNANINNIFADASTSGVLTLGGTGGANNENLTFDFEGAIVGGFVTVGTGTGTSIDFDLQLRLSAYKRLCFGPGYYDAAFMWQQGGNDSFQLGMRVGDAGYSGYFCIMEYADMFDADRWPLATTANPTLRIYSADATVATDYIEMYHDQVEGVLRNGVGHLHIDAASAILFDAGTGQFVFQNAGSSVGGIYAFSATAECLFGVRDTIGNQLILTNYDNRAKDHDLPPCTDPTLALYSDSSPDVSNNQKGLLYHDTEGLCFETGLNTGAGSAPTTNDNYFLWKPRGTEKMRLSGTGTLFFTDDDTGLPFGEIYANDVADELAIAVAGQVNKVQITSFAVDGVSNDTTPDHTNDHITITKAGMYLCTVSMTISSAGGGGADDIGYSVYKNNGATEFPNCHGHRKLAGGGGDMGSCTMSGIIDLALNDTIEVWIWNEDSADNVVVDDITLSLVETGGT